MDSRQTMVTTRPQDIPLRTRLRLVCLPFALSAVLLSGCQNLNMGAASPAQVRVLDASRGSGTVDVYRAGQPLAYNLEFGTITSYLPVNTASAPLSANTSGTPVPMISEHIPFMADGQYTVILRQAANRHVGFTVMQDSTSPAPAGQTGLRLVHESRSTGPLDVYLLPAGATLASAGASPIRLSAGASSGYFLLPAGSYTAAVVPAGTVVTEGTQALYLGSSLPLASGAQHTLFLLDAMGGGAGVQVVTATDVDPQAPPT